tara:strand:- start:528 stop:1454 length:927 start_codon:yes stop_codon:yes gene_type:complete
MPSPNYTPRPELDALVKDFDVTGNSQGYVGLSIMPLINTAVSSGEFPKIDANELMKRADTKRASRGSYNRIDTGFAQDNFVCTERGLEGAVDDSLAKIYASYLDAEVEVSNVVLGNLLLDQEIRIRDVVYAQTSNAVATPWSTYATATPRDNINDASETIRKRTGVKPNSIQMTLNKFRDILKCAELLDIAKFTGNILAMGIDAQKAVVSAFIGIPNIILAEAVENTSDEGQDFVGADIWVDTSAFLFVAGGTLQGGPKFGVTMDWTGDSAMNESYYEDQTRSTILRTRHWRDEKVQLTTAGWLLSSL